jgi:dihydroorotase
LNANPIFIQNGRVIDPTQNLDGKYNIRVREGKIAEIGKELVPQQGDTIIDASGKIVIAGMVDLHAHVYGGIGLEPDSVGVYTGVTSIIDAGSAGSRTFLDLLAVTEDVETDVYSVMFVEALGATDFKVNNNPKDLGSLYIGEVAQLVEKYPDKLLGFKSLALSDLGMPWVKMTRLLSEWFKKPTYYHIGNFRRNSIGVPLIREMLSMIGKGDIVTHCYTEEEGGFCGADGKPYPELIEAVERGLHLDIGHGKTGFSFKVAREMMDLGIFPHSVSSDVNVANNRKEVKNLPYVVSKIMALGLSIEQIVPMITHLPAKTLGIADRAGSLKVGYPADICIFGITQGEWEFEDTADGKVMSDKLMEPWKTLKNGKVFDANLSLALKLENYKYDVDRKKVPSRAKELNDQQKKYLTHLSHYIEKKNWEPENFQSAIHSIAAEEEIPLKDALQAIYLSFDNRAFGPQAGWFLSNLCKNYRAFVIKRFQEVAGL